MKRSRAFLGVGAVLFCLLGIEAAEAQLAPKAQQEDAQSEFSKNTNNRTEVSILADLSKSGMSVTESMDWGRWDLSKFPSAEQAISQCEAIVGALRKLHDLPGWKQALEKNLRKIECRFDGTHAATQGDQVEDQTNQAKDMELKSASFIYHMNSGHANVTGVAAFALRRDLASTRIDGGLTPDQFEAKAELDQNPGNTLRNLVLMNEACGTKIQMVFDWAHFDVKQWKDSSTAYSSCDQIANDISEYCRLKGLGVDWAGKRAVKQKIAKIECRFDGKHVCPHASDQMATAKEEMKDVELVSSTVVSHMHVNHCTTGSANLLLQNAFGS